MATGAFHPAEVCIRSPSAAYAGTQNAGDYQSARVCTGRSCAEVLLLIPVICKRNLRQVEEGTPFERWRQVGRIRLPPDDAAVEMYEAASERLRAAGYEHYEVRGPDRLVGLLFSLGVRQPWSGVPIGCRCVPTPPLALGFLEQHVGFPLVPFFLRGLRVCAPENALLRCR